MWDYDGFIGKAGTYFERAAAVDDADDDAFAIWLLAGLEFLLRAPLAKIHPTLLADPTGDSVLSAAGVSPAPDGNDPKSIPMLTVLRRLRRIVDGFASERANDAEVLMALRNRELHTSEATLASVEVSAWLPRFTRLSDVLCAHLGLDPEAIVGKEILEHGRALVDEEDKRLAHEIERRIAEAKVFVGQLSEIEVANRMPERKITTTVRQRPQKCPACALPAVLALEPIRTTSERLEDDQIFRDVILIARSLNCPVCGLALTNTAEIRAARIQQQYTHTEVESFEDRFLATYDPGEYGND